MMMLPMMMKMMMAMRRRTRVITGAFDEFCGGRERFPCLHICSASFFEIAEHFLSEIEDEKWQGGDDEP